VIQFRITVADLGIITVDTVMDTEELLSVIIGENVSCTKILNPQSPYLNTITISRVLQDLW
jgi:hypothetical protein